MRGFPASPRGEGGSHSSSVPQLSVGTLLAAWRGPAPPPPHATRWGPGRWGLRGGCSKSKFHTTAHSRHRTYPEAERDASSLRLQGLGGAGGSPPLSSSHDCARSRVCGTPARRVPPAAQLCTKAAWHCLACRARPAPRPLFPVRGRGARPFPPQPSPSPLAPTPLPGGPAGRNRAPGPELRRRGGCRSHCDVSSLRGYLYPHDWISFMKPGPGVSVRWGAGGKGADRPRTPREDIGFCFKKRAQLLTKDCVSPASSSPGKLHVLAGSPLWVTFLGDLGSP
ncbi:translation initiation factor IF-2-like [Mustela erminea]|uniref:translation initiation factor IF-2-like n=1 Tax=Mustela erminea TaxID=36723 RepID=UPI001386867E|nr:translation initiation factor IF-2-like [Mustela erminea]